MPYYGHLETPFAKPHKWALHRDLLRVKEDQVSLERLVGSTYLPQDGDQEFEAIAADFAKPTREDFLDGTVDFNYTQSPFWNVFSMLGQMMQLEEEAEGDQPYSQYFQMSKHTMEYLINILLGQVHLDTWFVLLRDSNISFHIYSCGVKGALKPAGVLSRCSDLRNKIILPVAMFSVMCPQKNKDAICHEFPQILIQAILMFQKNPTLKTHQPFALRVDGTKLQLSSALIPQTYIQNLSRGNPFTGELTIFHSVSYNLRDSTTNQNSGLSMDLTWEAKGGNTLLCNNPAAWCSIVASYYNWRVVKQEDLLRIEDMISIIPGFEDVKQRFLTLDPPSPIELAQVTMDYIPPPNEWEGWLKFWLQACNEPKYPAVVPDNAGKYSNGSMTMTESASDSSQYFQAGLRHTVVYGGKTVKYRLMVNQAYSLERYVRDAPPMCSSRTGGIFYLRYQNA